MAEKEITQAQIDQWKKKYGKVYKLIAEDGSVGYIRRPDRKILSHATAVAGTDAIKFNETILRDCWLGGDESLLDDDAKFLAISAQLDKVINTVQVELVEL